MASRNLRDKNYWSRARKRRRFRPKVGLGLNAIRQMLGENNGGCAQESLRSDRLAPFSCDLMRTVHADKTLCVRFDLNDYSVPPQALGRALTLVASPTTVRLLDGSSEIASHRRSYDRHQLVENPAHRQALLEQKRKALGSTAGGRLATLVPERHAFLPSRPFFSLLRYTTRKRN